MTAVLTDEARAAVTAGRLAHMVTVNPDGSPQVSLVWVGLDGDDIVSAHLGAWRKVQNLRRDPRVVLSIEAEGRNDRGMDRYLVVHGRAKVVEGGAPALLQRLAHVYLGPDVRYPPMDDPPEGFVVHVRPERLGGVGPWAE